MTLQSKLIFLLLFLLTVNGYSQQEYFNFTQIKKKEIAALEKAFDSKEFKSKFPRSYSGKAEEYGQPILFDRPKTEEFPAANVTYYYSKKDKIVRSVSFYWSILLPYGRYNSKKIDNYNTEFDRIVKLISSYIGDPAPGQGTVELVEDIVVSDPKTYSSLRTVKWHYKNCKVVTSLIWSVGHGQSFVTSIKWDE